MIDTGITFLWISVNSLMIISSWNCPREKLKGLRNHFITVLTCVCLLLPLVDIHVVSVRQTSPTLHHKINYCANAGFLRNLNSNLKPAAAYSTSMHVEERQSTRNSLSASNHLMLILVRRCAFKGRRECAVFSETGSGRPPLYFYNPYSRTKGTKVSEYIGCDILML